MIKTVIAKAHSAGAKVGRCGRAPGNVSSFARLLVEAGIVSMSATPDSVFAGKQQVGRAKAQSAG